MVQGDHIGHHAGKQTLPCLFISAAQQVIKHRIRFLNGNPDE
jgi:hypothetical protein